MTSDSVDITVEQSLEPLRHFAIFFSIHWLPLNQLCCCVCDMYSSRSSRESSWCETREETDTRHCSISARYRHRTCVFTCVG